MYFSTISQANVISIEIL